MSMLFASLQKMNGKKLGKGRFTIFSKGEGDINKGESSKKRGCEPFPNYE